MKIKIISAAFLLLLLGQASAQNLLFPELEGYKTNKDFPVFTPDNLWDYINGAADAYLTYGFVDLHIAEYKKGKNTIKVEIYKQGDNTNAFGIYSAERSPSFRFMNLGAQGYLSDGVANFYKGSYYVKIRTFSKNEKVLQSMEKLALRIADMLEGTTEMPAAILKFPEIGKKENEEIYINESVLGHKFLNKAFRATYMTGNDEFYVFILENKSNEEAWNSAKAYLESAGTDALESDNGKYVINDGYNGTIFLSWKANNIVIISGLSKDQANIADRYTSEILK
ncbi:MAG TPA: hypothetical protein PLR88_11525 [Bacteroidales bacterium]|nr:hypothetical protein [Bacteroidales bacterium]